MVLVSTVTNRIVPLSLHKEATLNITQGNFIFLLDPGDTQDSFELPLCTVREPPDKSLARYQAKMVSHSPRRQLITVQRSSNNIIRDVLKEYKRGSFDIQKVPDVEFIGEEGIDAKGLTREFSHIMMSCLREGKGGIAFFEGEMDHLLPVH